MKNTNDHFAEASPTTKSDSIKENSGSAETVETIIEAPSTPDAPPEDEENEEVLNTNNPQADKALPISESHLSKETTEIIEIKVETKSTASTPLEDGKHEEEMNSMDNHQTEGSSATESEKVE